LAERATEDDLWNENQMYSVQIAMFDKDFEADLDAWVDEMTVTKNEAAYKRYNPFDFSL
jgi:hypothetical protein